MGCGPSSTCTAADASARCITLARSPTAAVIRPIGNTHWDHISGFPFFTPLFVPGNHVTIYGARDLDRSLRDVLAGQMHYTYFPVPLVDLRADIEFSELEEGEIIIEDAVVRTHYLNHTAVCMGYRAEADGTPM